MFIYHASAGKVGGLLLGALALSLTAVLVTAAESQAPIVSVSPMKNAAVKDGVGLDKKLTLPAKRQPLSRLLRDIQSAASGGVQLSQAGSVKDEAVFCAVNGKTTRFLLGQIPRLLTDSEWQYQWQNWTPNVNHTPKDDHMSSADHMIYRLWREPVDAQARQMFARKQAHDRLARLLGDLRDDPQSGQPDQEDPSEAAILAQPLFRSWLAMVGTFSDSQIDGVLAGQPLTVPFSSLSPEQKALATQGVGGWELGIATAPNGDVSVDFDKRDLVNTGRVVIQAVPAGTDPGALSISLSIYSQADSSISMGGDVLHPDPDNELKPPAASDTSAPTAPVASAPPAPDAAQTVTLDAALKLTPGQTPLEGYLGAFAAQTHLSVLGYWSEDAKETRQRLPQSITQRPVKEALDILARAYHAKYVVEDQMVLFRSNFPKKVISAPAGTNASIVPKSTSL